MCAAWTPPPGLCMCAPTPTPTCVWVHCTCVHCRMHAHATRVHGTPWAHTRCAHYMPVTQRVSHTPPTCTCCCTATHTRVFQPPERQAFLALRSLITRLVSICVGAGGSRRTSSFPTPAGGAGRGRIQDGGTWVWGNLSLEEMKVPQTLFNFATTGGDSRPHPTHRAPRVRGKPVVVYTRGGHHHERPWLLSSSPGESRVFSSW